MAGGVGECQAVRNRMQPCHEKLADILHNMDQEKHWFEDTTMNDPTRARIDAGLSDVLARQLRALVDDWEPVDRHPVRISHTASEEEPSLQMATWVGSGEVWVDDLNALIARSYDFEAAEWLWHHAETTNGLIGSLPPKARLRHGQK